MKQCIKCGTFTDDNTRFCEECGYQFPLNMVCPQCGVPLSGSETFCENCGCNLLSVTAPSHTINQPVKSAHIAQHQGQKQSQTQYAQNFQPNYKQTPGNQHPVNSSNGNKGKAALFIALGVILGLLGGAVWASYNGMIDLGIKFNSQNEKEEIDTTIVSNVSVDTVSNSGISEDVVESVEEITDAPGTPEVYMSLWGSIGDSEEVDFEMNGTTGWYSYTRNGVKGPKRTLKLKSFDNLSRRCLIDAYLDGKYIGNFNGIFISDEVDMGDGDTKVIQTYDGVFNSVKGLKIDFYLYID